MRFRASASAVVLAQPDDTGGKILHAYVIPKAGAAI